MEDMTKDVEPIRTHSLAEIDALSMKAYRGLGQPWGLAEEAGKAVRWLSAMGLPATDAMAILLENFEAAKCPVRFGTAIMDGVDLFEDNADVISPLLLIAFLRDNIGRVVQWNDVTITICENGLHVSGRELLADTASVTVSNAHTNPSPNVYIAPDGRVINKDTLAILGKHAHKTYAPATEASRIAGAGAGLTDND